MQNKPKVTMMGLGYIGLPTAALMAGKGISVHGVDISQKVVDTINKGEIHIIEPDLDGLVEHVVSKGFLKADTKATESDVFLIAVPTPFKGNYDPDISYVESATRMIIPFLKTGNLVILESTSPVGTTELMAELIFKERPELKGKLYIAYCPERVLPGRVLYELENNERSIGGIDEASSQKAVEFYSLFVKGALHKTNARTAEMCKLVENSYRDVNIAFANELSILSDKFGINVWELIELANKHPRVKILSPGCGVGGHCIAVDPWFLVSAGGKDADLIKAARLRNNYKAEWVVEKVEQTAKDFEKKNNKKPKIACMGLAFKPNIDDLRESPAVEITEKLAGKNFQLLAVEPNIDSHPHFKITEYIDAAEQADIIVFLVAHNEFKNLNIGANKIILDFCGVRNGTC